MADRAAGIVPPGDSLRLQVTGADGLRRLGGRYAFSAQDPASFRAEVSALRIDGVTIGTFAATAHVGSRSGEQIRAHPEPQVTAMFAAEGRATFHSADRDVPVEQGALLLVSSGATFSYETDRPVRVLSASIGAERLPPTLLERTELDVRPLARTRLALSFIVFLRQLCAAPLTPMRAEGAYVARAVADLELGLIAEALGDSVEERGLDGLRHRIRDHIDRNLADQRLGPQSIAAALGVSVRYVHRAFNTTDVSVARYIRERRLEAVVRTITTEPRVPRIDVLAARFGFAGRDQLTRAFRAKYGTTIRDFHDAADPS